MTRRRIDNINCRGAFWKLARTHGVNVPMKWIQRRLPFPALMLSIGSLLPNHTLRMLRQMVIVLLSVKYAKFHYFASDHLCNQEYLENYNDGGRPNFFWKPDTCNYCFVRRLMHLSKLNCIIHLDDSIVVEARLTYYEGLNKNYSMASAIDYVDSPWFQTEGSVTCFPAALASGQGAVQFEFNSWTGL